MYEIACDLLRFRMREEVPGSHLSVDGKTPLCGRRMSRRHTVIREQRGALTTNNYCAACLKRYNEGR